MKYFLNIVFFFCAIVGYLFIVFGGSVAAWDIHLYGWALEAVALGILTWGPDLRCG
jgi:hypothetical protein